jgi:hypothetical protein
MSLEVSDERTTVEGLSPAVEVVREPYSANGGALVAG